jgi:hypothetical protein
MEVAAEELRTLINHPLVGAEAVAEMIKKSKINSALKMKPNVTTIRMK